MATPPVEPPASGIEPLFNSLDYDHLLDEAHRRGYIVSDRSWVMGYMAGWRAAHEVERAELKEL